MSAADLMERLAERFRLEGLTPKDAVRLAGLAVWEVDMTPDDGGSTCLCPCHLPPGGVTAGYAGV